MEVLLWLLVMWTGFGIGAGIYETRVVLPLWAGAPPDSLDRWHAAPFKIDPGLRFWIFCTPGLGLLSVGVLVSFFSIPGTPALFIKTGSALTLALVVWA